MSKEKLEKIIEECPNVKMGLDDFYGKQTMLNALKRAYNQALEDQKETLIAYQKFLIKNELIGRNASYNAELFLKEKIK